METRRWARRSIAFLVGSAAGSYVLAAFGYGVGLIVAVLVGALAHLGVWWSIPLFIGVFLVTSAVAIPVGRLLLPESWQAPTALTTAETVANTPESNLASKRKNWKPQTQILEENAGLMVDLQNSFRPEVTGTLACDVRAPIGAPERLTFQPGLRGREHAVYPQRWGVPMNGLIPGTYHVTWYEADEDWNWTEIAREEIEVARLEPRRAF